MSLNNEQLKDWFGDQFKDIKIRLSVNEDKSNEVLRRLDVITHETKDLRDTLYGADGLLEQFTVLRTEHAANKCVHSPEMQVAKKTLKTEKAALWVSGCAVAIAVFKDVLVKLIF
jgi:hypothetical protein